MLCKLRARLLASPQPRTVAMNDPSCLKIVNKSANHEHATERQSPIPRCCHDYDIDHGKSATNRVSVELQSCLLYIT